jgi:K+-sensing histidine kinase KdpD
MAKIESGQFKIQLDSYYIENIFNDIYDTFNKKINSYKVNLICQNCLKGKTLVRIDAYRLKQILIKLLTLP